MFQLLKFKLPFSGKTSEALKQSINDCDIDVMLSGMPGQYHVLLQVISRMLCIDPQQRISLNEIETMIGS